MNYRHEYHAGNFADVMKHTLLLALIRAMQRKEAGFLFVETHAGRGEYDLSRAATGDTHPRTPEWPEGLGRLPATLEGVPEAVADYANLVRAHDRRSGNLARAPRFYPGSPRIARAAARPQDRLALWESHPSEVLALRASFAGEKRVAVHEADGYGALRACLPPPERRALILIDPPFEAMDEWERIGEALREGLRRLPAGVFAVWHPLTGRARQSEFPARVERLGRPALVAEMIVDPSAPKMTGCGVLVINPPWRFDLEAAAIAGYLGSILGRDGAGRGEVRWIARG